MNRLLVLIALSLAASGCSIQQHVERVEIPEGQTLCVVENTDVREGFLRELRKILDEKKINYTITDLVTARACEWKVTYVARWSWDIALYMYYAEISVYRFGALNGEAVYDSTKGGARLDKFLDAEPKIRELVEQLL